MVDFAEIRGAESVIASVDRNPLRPVESCLRQLLFFSEYGSQAHVKCPSWVSFSFCKGDSRASVKREQPLNHVLKATFTWFSCLVRLSLVPV